MVIKFDEKKEMGTWRVTHCEVDGKDSPQVTNLEDVHNLLNCGEILNARGEMTEFTRSTVVELKPNR